MQRRKQRIPATVGRRRRNRKTTKIESTPLSSSSSLLLLLFFLTIFSTTTETTTATTTATSINNMIMVPLLLSHSIIVRAFRPTSTIVMIGRRSYASSSISNRLSLLNRNKGIAPVPISTTTTSRLLATSVTGTVYTAVDSGAVDSGEANNNNDNNNNIVVVVTLYTKEGCTLCDKVKDVLKNQISQNEYPHTLKQIDITDDDNNANQNQRYETYYDRYKYDIPVLHIGYENKNDKDSSNNNNNRSVYWTKHRLDVEEAKVAFKEAMEGTFQPRQGRPNATAMER